MSAELARSRFGMRRDAVAIVAGVFALLDAACTAAPRSTSVRYLAIGDSFTIGTGSQEERAFPARLAERWRARRCVVVVRNVAVNGYTTEEVIQRELSALEAFRPTFVTVAIGANDIAQGRSLEAYRTNVRRILQAARGTGARVVAIPQPDWPRSPAAATFGAPGALGEAVARFNGALAEEVRAQGAVWVDLAALMHRQADNRRLADDGLHPSAEAYDEWADELGRVLPLPCR